MVTKLNRRLTEAASESRDRDERLEGELSGGRPVRDEQVHQGRRCAVERGSGEKEARAPYLHLPPLLTVDDAASLLRTTKAAIYAMNARGQLAGVQRIGKRLLVRSDELLKWLDDIRPSSSKEWR